VGQPRVVRVAIVERIQQCDRALLLGEGGVGTRRRRDEREGVIDGHLDVVGEIPVQPGERIGVRPEALGIRGRRRPAVERHDRIDEALLPPSSAAASTYR